jgi:hypothetical protein
VWQAACDDALIALVRGPNPARDGFLNLVLVAFFRCYCYPFRFRLASESSNEGSSPLRSEAYMPVIARSKSQRRRNNGSIPLRLVFLVNSRHTSDITHER